MSRYMVLSGSLLQWRYCNRFFDAVKDFFLGTNPNAWACGPCVDHVWTGRQSTSAPVLARVCGRVDHVDH